jgi:hypothetical protein
VVLAPLAVGPLTVKFSTGVLYKSSSYHWRGAVVVRLVTAGEVADQLDGHVHAEVKEGILPPWGHRSIGLLPNQEAINQHYFKNEVGNVLPEFFGRSANMLLCPQLHASVNTTHILLVLVHRWRLGVDGRLFSSCTTHDGLVSQRIRCRTDDDYLYVK